SILFVLSLFGGHLDLHSFPTRRSSDLKGGCLGGAELCSYSPQFIRGQGGYSDRLSLGGALPVWRPPHHRRNVLHEGLQNVYNIMHTQLVGSLKTRQRRPRGTSRTSSHALRHGGRLPVYRGTMPW